MILGTWISPAVLSFIPIFAGWYTTDSHARDLELYPDQCIFEVNRVYAVVSSSISFWIPCTIMLFTYYAIFKEANRQEKQLALRQGSAMLMHRHSSGAGGGGATHSGGAGGGAGGTNGMCCGWRVVWGCGLQGRHTINLTLPSVGFVTACVLLRPQRWLSLYRFEQNTWPVSGASTTSLRRYKHTQKHVWPCLRTCYYTITCASHSLRTRHDQNTHTRILSVFVHVLIGRHGIALCCLRMAAPESERANSMCGGYAIPNCSSTVVFYGKRLYV